MYRLITANRNYSSWSLRPWVLMKQLGIPFEDVIEPFAAASNYDAFRGFSPSGTVPCLIDGARTVWDSLGITLYLGDRHGAVWPMAIDARAWAGCVVAEMHSGFSTLRNMCPMNVGVRAELNAVPETLARDVRRIGEIWAEGLERFGGPWLAGEAFSAADAFYAPVAYRVQTYGLDVSAAGAGWIERLLSLPAMQEWERAALAESWREVGHEEEIGAVATVVADHRAA